MKHWKDHVHLMINREQRGWGDHTPDTAFQKDAPSDQLLQLGPTSEGVHPMVAPTAGPGVFHTWEGWDAVNHTEKTSRQKLGMLAAKSWQSEYRWHPPCATSVFCISCTHLKLQPCRVWRQRRLSEALLPFSLTENISLWFQGVTLP